MTWKPVAVALLVGALAGAGLTYYFACGPAEPRDSVTVTKDTTRMGWDELVASLPTETTVRAPDSSQEECLDVPERIVDEEAPPPDTVYHRLYTETALLAPSIDYGDRAGLAPRARSRHPFLYLPLLDGGRPAIEHTGRTTVVRAYGAQRGYEFTYTYEPPTLALWLEGYAGATWTPPTAPTTAYLQGGARLGATIQKKWGRLEPSVGAAVTPIGPAATASLSFRNVLIQL